MFERVRHRILNIQLVVKPSNNRSWEPLHSAIQRHSAPGFGQQLWGQLDQELGLAGEVTTTLLMGEDIREIEVADQVVRSLGRRRRSSHFLDSLLLVLVRETATHHSVCLRHFTHRIGRGGDLSFDICFFC